MIGTVRTSNLLSMMMAVLMISSLLSGFVASSDSGDGEQQELLEQAPQWFAGKTPGDWLEKAEGDSSTTYGGSVTTSTAFVDSQGHTHLTGFIIGDTKFGSTTLNTGQDAFVAEMDAQGNWVDVKHADTYAGGGFTWARDVTVDTSGNKFITGYYAGNVSFGSHQLRSTPDSNGDDTIDVFVAKLGSNGNWAWAETAGGSYDNDIGNAIASDGSGGAYVAGGFNISANFGMNGYGSAGYTDAFVAHIDSSGNWDWVTTGGGPNSDSIDAVAVDSNGDLRVAGTFTGGGGTQGAQFGSQSFNAIGAPDLFVSKITSSGSWSWTVAVGAPSGQVVPFGFDADGTDAYVGGLFAGTAAFDSHSITSAASSNNAFIAKVDQTGAWQWAEASNGTGIQYIGSIDASSKGVAFSGGFSSGQTSSATFGSTTLTGTYFELLAGVISTSGNWMWTNSGGSDGDDGYYNWGSGGVGWTPSGDVIAVHHICQGMSSSCTATFGSLTQVATPKPYNTQIGLPSAVVVWKQASDADGDGIADGNDNCPLVSNSGQEDIDSDSLGDVCDPDLDGDGIDNSNDACDGPAVNWDASTWANDIDLDGCRDIDEDTDDDEDGIDDVSDPCTGQSWKLNWTSSVVNDKDEDGCHDMEEDDDDDNDAIPDGATDLCDPGMTNWMNPDGTHNSSADYDTDGCRDIDEDNDDDNDGIDDFDEFGAVLDRCPTGILGWVSDTSNDVDQDGCRDSDEDWDDDNDGVNDLSGDGSTLDQCSPGMMGWLSNEQTDRDGDGCRDLDEDDDIDGDGVKDDVDSCFQEALWTSDSLTDYDGDGCRDMDEDPDDDGDGVPDTLDNCSKGEKFWDETDFDNDGCRDETEDLDDDGDKVCDGADSSTECTSGPDLCDETPLGESVNADGCGLMTQVDTDGDGLFDGYDDCEFEAAVEGFDLDQNGCTDDSDDDNSTDDIDAFPNDPNQQTDRDGDGWGDNPGHTTSDSCPDTPADWVFNSTYPNGFVGCAWEEGDDDEDEIINGLDDCPGSAHTVDANGCSDYQKDADKDGVSDAEDDCETTVGDYLLDDAGCSHEQRLAAGDTDAMLHEYGLILGIVSFILLSSIVAMGVMLTRRKKGGRPGSMDAWDVDNAQLSAGGYVGGEPAAPVAAPAQASPQSVPSYAQLPPGGSYVNDAVGGTWYNAPDGSQWAMQGDGSFIRQN